MRGIVDSRDQGLQPLAARGKRQVPQVFVALGQDIVDAQMHREVGDQFRRHRLAVQALLKHVETLDATVSHNQQFAVDRPLERQRLDKIGKRPRHILARTGIDAPDRSPVARAAGNGLQADAVPFPFADEIRGVEFRKVFVFQRMRQHGRTERRGVVRFGLGTARFRPGEQFLVGSLKAVPDQLDLVRLKPAELRDRGLGEAG